MKRKWMVLISLAMVVCLLPLNALAGLYWGDVVLITARSSANVRKGPGGDYGMVGEAKCENTYTVLGEENGWYYIQFTADKRGYVSSKYAQLQTGLIWEDGVPGEVDAVVRNTHYNALNVRNRASLDSRVLGEIKPDTTWPYRGTENGWHRILYEGVIAYVAANRTTVEVTGEMDTTGGATGAECDVCGGTGICPTCDGDGIICKLRKRLGPASASTACSGSGLCWACSDDH